MGNLEINVLLLGNFNEMNSYKFTFIRCHTKFDITVFPCLSRSIQDTKLYHLVYHHYP